MTLLVRKFNKFLKREGGLKQFQKKEAKNPTFNSRIPKKASLAISVGRRISDMKKELDEMKLENETLDLIYSCALCNYSSKIIEAAICEKCQILDAKNSVLKNKMAKFTYSRQNLDTLHASSRNVDNRTSSGYRNTNIKKAYRRHVGQTHNLHQTNLPARFYCGTLSQTSGSCHICRHGVPSGKYI
ncbi:hypothetical protein Lal_00036777 [Lupinus albus]|nr:hypothetical protein Lal_00036777 [Lupinus albus]